MKPNPVGWFEIYVEDMARARSFYEGVFGVTLEPLQPPVPEGDAAARGMEMWVFPMAEDLYGAPGTLVRVDGMRSGTGGIMVYFSCDDCALEAGRVAAHGGRVLQEKMPIGQYGFIAVVNDSEGNTIGLHSRQ